MASGYSFSSTTDPDNNTLAYDKNGRLKIISVPPVDVSVTNPITNDNNTLGLNYDNVTLNLSSGTGAPLQINLAHANTWTGTQSINTTSGYPLELTSTGAATVFINMNNSSGQYAYMFGDGANFEIVSTTGGMIFLIQDGYYITIQNGSGVTQITLSSTGIVSANGIKTTAGAATAVTVGASPYTYTNSSASNQQIFIQGGTVSAISFNPNGGTGISLSGLTDNVITMRPNDTLTITYTAAPTVNTIQL